MCWLLEIASLGTRNTRYLWSSLGSLIWDCNSFTLLVCSILLVCKLQEWECRQHLLQRCKSGWANIGRVKTLRLLPDGGNAVFLHFCESSWTDSKQNGNFRLNFGSFLGHAKSQNHCTYPKVTQSQLRKNHSVEVEAFLSGGSQQSLSEHTLAWVVRKLKR